MPLVKRFAVTIAGSALLVLGLAMMVLPGPGILVIVAGLAILATEYVWAQRLLKRARTEAEKVQEATVSSPVRTGATMLFGLGLLAVGVAMLVVQDVDLPFWSPVTGGILAVTALILLTTTYLTWRAARGEETTHTAGKSSSVRVSQHES